MSTNHLVPPKIRIFRNIHFVTFLLRKIFCLSSEIYIYILNINTFTFYNQYGLLKILSCFECVFAKILIFESIQKFIVVTLDMWLKINQLLNLDISSIGLFIVRSWQFYQNNYTQVSKPVCLQFGLTRVKSQSTATLNRQEKL